jgi:hypothetical protein
MQEAQDHFRRAVQEAPEWHVAKTFLAQTLHYQSEQGVCECMHVRMYACANGVGV